MTTEYRDHGVAMSRCRRCDHDLVAHQNRKRDKARVYCSNPDCKYASKAYPVGSSLNAGK